jgi:hypothetical protein
LLLFCLYFGSPLKLVILWQVHTYQHKGHKETLNTDVKVIFLTKVTFFCGDDTFQSFLVVFNIM